MLDEWFALLGGVRKMAGVSGLDCLFTYLCCSRHLALSEAICSSVYIVSGNLYQFLPIMCIKSLVLVL
jgi:hypothetical protein